MVIVDDVLREAGFSATAIADVKAGKLHYGGSLDAASDKELSVKLAFHVKAKLESAKEIFLDSPKKKEYDPTVESLGEFLYFPASSRRACTSECAALLYLAVVPLTVLLLWCCFVLPRL
jgi:hypothetical protein